MRRFQVNRRRAAAAQRFDPAGHANAPAIAGLQPWKVELGMWRDEVVPIEHGEIEELLRYLHADRVQPEIFRPGATITVAIETGERFTAATFQFGPENVRRHAKRYIKVGAARYQ